MVVCASGTENDGFWIDYLFIFLFQARQFAVSFHKAAFQVKLSSIP